MRRLRALPVVFGLLLAAEFVKQGAIFATGPVALQGDAGQYWQLAGLAADGDWLLNGSRIAYRTPGYPAFVGLCRALFGADALTAAVALQHLLVICTSLATAWLCGWLSGRGTVAIAGYAMSVCCLTRPWYANTALTETLFTFLLIVHVSAVMVWLRSMSALSSAAAGFALAACILVRPVAQLLWLPVLAVALWPSPGGQPGRSGRRAATSAAVGLAVLLIALAPWLVRNWRSFGKPFLTRFLGRNLWIVSFQGGAGAGLPLPREGPGATLAGLLGATQARLDLTHSWTVSNALCEAGLSDPEIDDLMTAVCLQAVKANPRRFAFAYFRRFVNYWRCVVNRFPSFGPSQWTGDGFDGQRVWRSPAAARICNPVLSHTAARCLLMNELATLAVLIGAAGLLAKAETRRGGIALCLVLLYFSAVTAALEIENYRYRMVLEPVMIVAATCGFSNLVSLRRRSSRNKTGGP